MSEKQFFKKDNLDLLLNIFYDYMNNKHNKIFDIDEKENIKKDIFQFMVKINKSNPNSDVHKLNMLVLQEVRNKYLTNLNSSKKPNIKLLERETQVYGNRHNPNLIDNRPLNNPYSKNIDKEYENLINYRDKEEKNNNDITKLGKPISDNAEDTEEFMKKVKELEDERKAVEDKFRNQIKPPHDLENFINPILDEKIQIDNVQENFKDFLINQPTFNECLDPSFNKDDKITSFGQNLIISRDTENSKLKHITKYISVNSFDRDWSLSPLRYNYSVSFNGSNIQNKYKNITSIEVGKVIIPDEIFENTNIINAPNRTKFNQEFSFSFPYLILVFDEFKDIYDGTNDKVRQGFCKLVYYRSYKAPNGRGYVILKPIQKEKKYFYPSPLSSIQKLSMSLLKPNGNLFNDSNDAYKIFKIGYDAFNPKYLSVTTDIFFDKNEFFVGDDIIIRNYNIDPTSIPSTNVGDIKNLVDFVNRQEGHEVVQIGTTNNNGFYRTFYIMAPGQFDKTQGIFNVNMSQISALNDYNNTIDYNTYTGSNGNLMNFSLQNSIGLSLDILVEENTIHSTLL